MLVQDLIISMYRSKGIIYDNDVKFEFKDLVEVPTYLMRRKVLIFKAVSKNRIEIHVK